ncbi:MAG TPA: hypothetical protein VGI29_01425 [Candidatus Binataceae bacterium]
MMSSDRPHRRGGRGSPLARWVRIFVATVMLTTGAGALVTHDLLARWDLQVRLQLDATRMVIAAAVFLPDAPARAMHAAARSAEVHGLSREEVVRAEAAPDRMSFSVTLRRSAPVLLFRLLGSRGALVIVHAVARVHPYAPPRRPGGQIALSMPQGRKKSLNALSPRSCGGEVLIAGGPDFWKS